MVSFLIGLFCGVGITGILLFILIGHWAAQQAQAEKESIDEIANAMERALVAHTATSMPGERTH